MSAKGSPFVLASMCYKYCVHIACIAGQSGFHSYFKKPQTTGRSGCHSKMEFSILFYWLVCSDLLMLIMPSDKYHRTLLMISQAPSHYLNQCWPRSPMPYGVTRPQRFNHDKSKHNRTLGIYCGRNYIFTLETKSCHNANFVIIDSTGGCHNDNPQGPPGMTKLASWQFWVFTVDRKLCINVAPSSAHQLTMFTMSTEVSGHDLITLTANMPASINRTMLTSP